MALFEKYGYLPDEAHVSRRLQEILSNSGKSSPEILKKCFSFMDLTTLHPEDTADSVRRLVDKVNLLEKEYPDYPIPASVCVFPNFASVVRDARNSPDFHVTTVAGCFPASQSFLEVKVKEAEMAVADGADEVDMVLALNSFLAGDYESAYREIAVIKQATDRVAASLGRTVILKVILETGILRTVANIANASFLAMEAGADFIKTSTGKVSVNATPEAALVMCECIKAFYAETGRAVGFKAAGGISDAGEAFSYYSTGASVLGDEWMNKGRFRFGVSRLGNSLMSAIEGKTVSYF